VKEIFSVILGRGDDCRQRDGSEGNGIDSRPSYRNLDMGLVASNSRAEHRDDE